ncbi:MAG: purine-nucleoside phosphorylase [Ruminococcaceae bacterium]|nr:purine-nucleoside phosphorylase [Oscillospiraceae bacterium]
MTTIEQLRESAQVICDTFGEIPQTAMVLGSGFGEFAKILTDTKVLPYADIPHMCISTAPDHVGRLVCGKVNGVPVLLMQGRLHHYEGYSFAQTVYPVQALSLAGVKNLILTNAAGGINTDYAVGDFSLITDHIKLCDPSPMHGANIPELGPRFFDMTNAYDKTLRTLALQAAQETGIALKEGVYAYMSGPQFETPAEIRALNVLGADLVGMSTVAETIAANHCGMKVLGISCVTNMAAGVTGAPITSEEVNETGAKMLSQFSTLAAAILAKIAQNR